MCNILCSTFFTKNNFSQVSLVKNLVNKSENKGPAGALRGNSIRVLREIFLAQIRNDFAAAVSARHVFFSNRVVPHWNKLPENVVKSKSTAKFKMALDKFNGIGGYSSTRPIGGDGLRQSPC
ncbi:hypothetical protein BpHYR1_032129 [Brachionus plicatilis]|uniref:RNA-directed DNA polymerase from mobile element jockey-like n=1 Tax=Brachionus plicatilis TaxID=10195 RepID=A0A3M7QN69_BRAPC|nr:hypothetical protein BpHYR1_032129 [Brachionus plicatilis]